MGCMPGKEGWLSGRRMAFGEIVEVVKRNEKPSDVRNDINDSADRSIVPSQATRAAPPKPWQKKSGGGATAHPAPQ